MRSTKKRRIPQQVRDALEATGLPYEFTTGGSHIKIMLNGRLVGISPLGKFTETYGANAAIKNTIAQIRRAAKDMAGGD